MDSENKLPEKNLNSVVVKALSGEKVNIMESRAIPIDEFESFYSSGDVLQPLYSPEQLIRLAETSDILQQCIEAYKTNIAGFGTMIDYDVDYDKLSENDKKSLDVQWNKYTRFIQFCNFDESFVEIIKKMIDDREKIGYGCLEVIEDGSGEPAGIEHIQAHKVRMCPREKQLVDIKTTIVDENEKEIEITIKKRFRKFVQIVAAQKVYFKEFGDPRTLNYKTGEYSENVPEEDRASSIIFFNTYCPYTEYGLPRYMGQLLNILGNRRAEELNYKYFTDGRHIPLAIIIENGKLTPESEEQLQMAAGNIASHKFLLLEAEGLQKEVSLSEDTDKSAVKIRLEKLVEIMEKDGLFQEYCKNNRDKIRSAYRLHPIYTGESQDYTRATADTARQITEEQVFQPEREDIQFRLNNLLKPALGISDVSMKFKSPKLSDKAEIANALTTYINGGAASPNMIIDALGELLGKSIEPYEEEWADKPLQIALKEFEAKKQETQSIPLVEDNAVGNENEATGIQKADMVSDIIYSLKSLQRTIEEATE